MAKEDETPRANPAEIENLIEQIRRTNLEPGAKEKIERLLRTVLTLVELLQRKNTSIKKLRQMIFGRWTLGVGISTYNARRLGGEDVKKIRLLWSPYQVAFLALVSLGFSDLVIFVFARVVFAGLIVGCVFLVATFGVWAFALASASLTFAHRAFAASRIFFLAARVILRRFFVAGALTSDTVGA